MENRRLKRWREEGERHGWDGRGLRLEENREEREERERLRRERRERRRRRNRR